MSSLPTAWPPNQLAGEAGNGAVHLRFGECSGPSDGLAFQAGEQPRDPGVLNGISIVRDGFIQADGAKDVADFNSIFS